jgi:FixJ family two-component response regulator
METDRKILIVIVDDDLVLRQALASLFSAMGYRVQSYASAAEFFATAATTEAACLILDIQLGAVSGIELAQQLAASGANFPIIFMTGSDDERFQRDLDVGAVDFLHKPFRVEDLMPALSRAIGSRIDCAQNSLVPPLAKRQ